MAFSANVNYVGHQQLRQDALEGVTRAKLDTKLRAEAEARRQAAIAASKKKKSSFGRKIIGAVARGAAAYYTGGASEATGMGRMVDQQIQGGNDYESNEYGELAGAVASTGKYMTAEKVNAAAGRLSAQSARDDATQVRMDAISPRAGLQFAEKRAQKDIDNRAVFDAYKKEGIMNFGQDVDGLDLSATVIDYSGLGVNDNKIEPPTPQTTAPAAQITYNGGEDFESNQEHHSPLVKPVNGTTSQKLTPRQKRLFSNNDIYNSSPGGSVY
jgi:hypothetical protein